MQLQISEREYGNVKTTCPALLVFGTGVPTYDQVGERFALVWQLSARYYISCWRIDFAAIMQLYGVQSQTPT
jgi:hypothetical protein